MSDDLSNFSLIDLFRLEAEAQVEILNSGLLALEEDADPATIEPLMRAAHSLKGAARIVGMSAAEQVAHALEDVLVAAQNQKIRLSSGDIDRLLAGVDLLQESSRLDEASLPAWLVANADRIDEMVARLKNIEANDSSTNPAIHSQQTLLSESSPSESDSTQTTSETPPTPPERPQVAPNSVETGESPRVAPPAPEKTASPEAARSPASDTPDRVVRVTAENLNRLMGLAGESLVEARRLRPLVDSLVSVKDSVGDLWKRFVQLEELAESDPARLRALLLEHRQLVQRTLGDLNDRHARMESHARRAEDLAERLHFEVISSRLRPMIDGTRGFPRLVRDVSRQLGKNVRFELVGEQTGVDRDILERLEAPLNHLIRNALDHGIEEPQAREAAGKPPVATIRLEARHVAGMLQITLSDDGRGIDTERIRSRVVQKGLVSDTLAQSLTEPELLEFLFLPGFSTKERVTELSGRGVGLDVVQSMVQEVGGSVRVSSKLGQGTTFSLQLPITMSVIRALLVRIGGEPYAFPLSRIDRILIVPVSDVERVEGRRLIRVDDQSLGLVSAAQVLELPTQHLSHETLSIVVVSDRTHSFGVVVEEILGERDLDVRPLDPRLGKVPNLNSVSILEDGWPVLIIDVEDLVRSIDNLLHGRKALVLSETTTQSSTTRSARKILVVDDSITVRELERQLLENKGYKVDLAIDGMDGWNAVRSGTYDLVVSDVDMPRMDGIQLVRHIKQDPRLSSIPVVIVSYKDRQEDRMRGLDAGADAYLTKSSFQDETFLRTIVDLIGEPTE